MKARISMPAEKPLVLAYGLSAERMAALAGLLEKLGFGWREIQPEQLGLTVEILAGDSLPEYSAFGGPAFPEEALVLCNLSKAELNWLLRELRQASLTVDRKAVLTPTNRNWTFGQLLEEIDREHRQMHAR